MVVLTFSNEKDFILPCTYNIKFSISFVKGHFSYFAPEPVKNFEPALSEAVICDFRSSSSLVLY